MLLYNLPQYSLMALQQSKMGQVTEICYCLLPACEQQQQAKHISTLIGGVLETKEITITLRG